MLCSILFISDRPKTAGNFVATDKAKTHCTQGLVFVRNNDRGAIEY